MLLLKSTPPKPKAKEYAKRFCLDLCKEAWKLRHPKMSICRQVFCHPAAPDWSTATTPESIISIPHFRTPYWFIFIPHFHSPFSYPVVTLWQVDTEIIFFNERGTLNQNTLPLTHTHIYIYTYTHIYIYIYICILERYSTAIHIYIHTWALRTRFMEHEQLRLNQWKNDTCVQPKHEYKQNIRQPRRLKHEHEHNMAKCMAAEQNTERDSQHRTTHRAQQVLLLVLVVLLLLLLL